MNTFAKRDHYESFSYRDLQKIAKGLRLPANLKKKYLVELICAQKNGDDTSVKNIVDNALKERTDCGSSRRTIIKSHADTSSQIESSQQTVSSTSRDPYVIINNHVYNTRDTRSKFKNKQSYPAAECTPLTPEDLGSPNMTCRFSDHHYGSTSTYSEDYDYGNKLIFPKAASTPRAVGSPKAMDETDFRDIKKKTVLETLLKAPKAYRAGDVSSSQASPIHGVNSHSFRQLKVVGDRDAAKLRSFEPSSKKNRPFVIPKKIKPGFSLLRKDTTLEANQMLKDADVQYEVNGLLVDTANPQFNINTQLEDPTILEKKSSPELKLPSLFEYQYSSLDIEEGGSHCLESPKNLDNGCNQSLNEFYSNPDFNIILSNPNLESHSYPDHTEAAVDSLKALLPPDPYIPVDRETGSEENLNYSNYNCDIFNLDPGLFYEGQDQCNASGQNDSGNVSGASYSQKYDEFLNLADYNVNDEVIHKIIDDKIAREHIDYPQFTAENCILSENEEATTVDNSLMTDVASVKNNEEKIPQANVGRSPMAVQNIQQTIYDVDVDYNLPANLEETPGIGEMDPLLSALLMNFQSYSSLGLSPPIADQQLQASEHQIIANEGLDSREKIDTHEHWEEPMAVSLDMSDTVCSGVICFLCKRMGLVANFEEHLRTNHPKLVSKTIDGEFSFNIPLDKLIAERDPARRLAIIDYNNSLYVVNFKFEPPESICAIAFAVPPKGHSFTSYIVSVILHIEIEHPITGEVGKSWCGNIACLNKVGQLARSDTCDEGSSCRFVANLRNTKIVPDDVACDERGLKDCLVMINLFLQTVA